MKRRTLRYRSARVATRSRGTSSRFPSRSTRISRPFRFLATSTRWAWTRCALSIPARASNPRSSHSNGWPRSFTSAPESPRRRRTREAAKSSFAPRRRPARSTRPKSTLRPATSRTWRPASITSVPAISRFAGFARVTFAKPAKREIAGTEVIEAGRQVLDVAGRNVDFGLVERAGRRRGAKEDFAASRVRLLLGDSGAEVKERGQPFECELRGFDARAGIESAQRVHAHRVDVARKRNGREIRVDLEGKRLDVPRERVATR